MAREQIIEEFHITVLVPIITKEATCRAIRRMLHRKRFKTGMGRAIQEVVARHADVHRARFVLGR